MLPINFRGQNTLLKSPTNDPSFDCLDLPVYAGPNGHGQSVIKSVWKLNKEELQEIQETGCLSLVIYGTAHPPVWLSVENPFALGKSLMVNAAIADNTATALFKGNNYAFTKLPKECTGLALKDDGDGWYSLTSEEGLAGYSFNERVELVGIGTEIKDMDNIFAILREYGYERKSTAVLQIVD